MTSRSRHAHREVAPVVRSRAGAHRAWALVWARRHDPRARREQRDARRVDALETRPACPALPARAIASSPARRPQCRARPAAGDSSASAYAPITRSASVHSRPAFTSPARCVRSIRPSGAAAPASRRPISSIAATAIDLGARSSARDSRPAPPTIAVPGPAPRSSTLPMPLRAVIGHAGKRRAHRRVRRGHPHRKVRRMPGVVGDSGGPALRVRLHERGDRRVERRPRAGGPVRRRSPPAADREASIVRTVAPPGAAKAPPVPGSASLRRWLACRSPVRNACPDACRCGSWYVAWSRSAAGIEDDEVGVCALGDDAATR